MDCLNLVRVCSMYFLFGFGWSGYDCIFASMASGLLWLSIVCVRNYFTLLSVCFINLLLLLIFLTANLRYDLSLRCL